MSAEDVESCQDAVDRYHDSLVNSSPYFYEASEAVPLIASEWGLYRYTSPTLARMGKKPSKLGISALYTISVKTGQSSRETTYQPKPGTALREANTPNT